MSIIASTIKKLMRSPGKAVMTLLTVALGVAILIIALSISRYFTKTLDSALSSNGIILTVSNGTLQSDGNLEQARPPQFDEQLIPALLRDIDGAKAVAPVASVGWSNILVGDKSYRLRSMAGTNESYTDVFNLQIIAGSGFTSQDVADGKALTLLSESLAVMLFGSPEDAVGKIIRPPGFIGGQAREAGIAQAQGRFRISIPDFTVAGVYADPPDTQRRAYQMADLIVPYTAVIPSGMAQLNIARFVNSTIFIRMESEGVNSAESLIRNAVTTLYGEDTPVTVYEGAPGQATTVLEDLRKSIRFFSTLINILGFILLFSGSIGILSIMLVDVLGRTREIALERALGASKGSIMQEYAGRAMVISLFSVGIGLVLGLLLSRPILHLVLPIFSAFSDVESSASLISIQAVLIAAGSALLTGAVFGMLPVHGALKTSIVEGIREV